MKVCVVGAGGIGGTLAARLAAADHPVCVVARGAQRAAIERGGLQLVDHVGLGGGVFRLPVAEDPGQLAAAQGEQDLIIVGLKAHAIGAMLPRLAPLVGPHTVVLPAINGLPWWYFHRAGGAFDGRAVRAVDPEGTMFAALDGDRILGCVVHIAAEVRAPGVVHHTGGRKFVLGEPARGGSARLDAVCALLASTGLEATASADIRADIWWKLLGNLSFNPVAALTGYLMDAICNDAGVLEVIRAVMLEGMAVSRHYGYPMAMTPDQRIDVARHLGAAKISMLQDIEQRRKLELDAIVGSVIELAELADLAVPATRHLYALTAARARALGIA